MIKPDMIPFEVVEAAARALANNANLNWDDVPYAHNIMRGEAREAIAAAINAWPGFEYRADAAFPAFGYGPAAIILPLSQEASDE